MCSDHRHLGIAVDGGFATHVLVPHPRYLLDYAPLSPSFAGPLMCSGLTAYAALKRHTGRPERGPVLLVGLGGVGMMGLAIARALFRTPPIVADIDAEKRKAALAAGAAQAYDPSDPQARKAVMTATGGLLAICDFVGSDKSLQFATGLLARGGKVVVTGLLGGDFSMAAAMFGIKAMTIEGTLTGTLAEARELLDLARVEKYRADPDARPPAGGSTGGARRFARRPGRRPHGVDGLVFINGAFSIRACCRSGMASGVRSDCSPPAPAR